MLKFLKALKKKETLGITGINRVINLQIKIMNLQKKLSENLILHYVEANNWDHDEEGK